MRVVGLVHRIRDGELQLVRPDPVRLGGADEAEARPEIEQDRGALADHDIAVAQERRREGRSAIARIGEAVEHRLDAAGLVVPPRDVDIVGTGLFEGEVDELAAPWIIGSNATRRASGLLQREDAVPARGSRSVARGVAVGRLLGRGSALATALWASIGCRCSASCWSRCLT